MKKWLVSVPLSADAIYKVEAETAEDAINKTYAMGIPTLCWQCSDEVDIGDFSLDGDPITEEIDD